MSFFTLGSVHVKTAWWNRPLLDEYQLETVFCCHRTNDSSSVAIRKTLFLHHNSLRGQFHQHAYVQLLLAQMLLHSISIALTYLLSTAVSPTSIMDALNQWFPTRVPWRGAREASKCWINFLVLFYFYLVITITSLPHTKKSNVNQMAQKLLIKWW